jgi:hypothetical protein
VVTTRSSSTANSRNGGGGCGSSRKFKVHSSARLLHSAPLFAMRPLQKKAEPFRLCPVCAVPWYHTGLWGGKWRGRHSPVGQVPARGLGLVAALPPLAAPTLPQSFWWEMLMGVHPTSPDTTPKYQVPQHQQHARAQHSAAALQPSLPPRS